MKGFKEVTLKYDVVVVGGGMTGLCAAMASARHGAKTALVQDRPVLGGNASSEVRMHICGATANMKKPELSEGGIVHELMLSNKRVNDSYNFSIWDAVMFDAAKKTENLTMYLNTAMHAAHREGDEIKSITCYQMSTEKRLTLEADIFADCTGNGTLGAFVDASFRTGSESKAEFNEPHAPEVANKERMGNTLLFKAANVGHPVKFIPPVDAMHFTEEQLKYRKHTADVPPETLAKASKEEIWMLFDGFCQDYGYWWIEIGGVEDDIINEYEDIRDQLVRAVYGVWDHIKNGGEHGADNYELVWVGMLPGVRESRRLDTDYMLNENDVLENRRFEDAVAYGGWHIDNHCPGGLYSFDKLPSFVYEFDGAYTIPYGSYVAKGLKNLYVGGRCMGASKLAMATSRVMGTCAIGGQAIGTAAAQCVKRGVDIRNVDIHELQQTLLRDDCFIPGIACDDKNDLAKAAKVTASGEIAGYEAANILSGTTRAIDGNTNCWHAEMGEAGAWIQLDLPEAKNVREVQLVFDSNFDLEKKISLSSRRQRQQEIGIPKELVKDYDVELLLNGEVVQTIEMKDNYQRLVRIAADAQCDAVRVHVKAVNGINEARIFEVRLYEEAGK